MGVGVGKSDVSMLPIRAHILVEIVLFIFFVCHLVFCFFVVKIVMQSPDECSFLNKNTKRCISA
jgi:hypothetical protein